MTDTKPWWASKGIWGALIAGVGILLNIFGFDFSSADQEVLGGQVDNIITAVGALLGLWGRISATKTVSGG